jgi:hypothetical protein
MRNHRFVETGNLILVFLIIAAIVCSLGCVKRKRNEKEKLTVKRIGPMCPLLEEYRTENMYYPESWEELLSWKGIEMPVNPYTGEKMVALDSPQFDPEKSPGNIYYMKVVKDGEVINCQVIIFGDRGEITRYDHTVGFAAK